MSRDVFGFALPAGNSEFAAHAYVFFHRAEEPAQRKHAVGGKHCPSLAMILGHIMAHELGHLLLGRHHQPPGIMTADWKKRELSKMTQRTFGFIPREGELLRPG